MGVKVSEEKPLLTKVGHTASSKRIIVQTKHVVISKIQMQMICDIPVFFGNGILMPGA